MFGKCYSCSKYDKKLCQCAFGKVCPSTLQATREVAMNIGVWQICVKCDYRKEVMAEHERNLR